MKILENIELLIRKIICFLLGHQKSGGGGNFCYFCHEDNVFKK